VNIQHDFGPLLRRIRQAAGLSLYQLETKSDGKWKAVVVGSYERGDRDPTIYRSAALLEYYRHRLEILAPGDIVVRGGLTTDGGVVRYSVISPAGDEIQCTDYAEAIRMLGFVAGSRLAKRITGPLLIVEGPHG
jgi:transcriptional regulator with XRE-family HTH domain